MGFGAGDVITNDVITNDVITNNQSLSIFSWLSYEHISVAQHLSLSAEF